MGSILIVDDSAVARQRLVDILITNGNQVIEAANGHDGIEKAEKCKPDCIVLDLLMPDINGVEVLKVLKQKNLDIPTIILSADIQVTTQNECMENGAAAFLEKPVNENELIEVLQGIFCSK